MKSVLRTIALANLPETCPCAFHHVCKYCLSVYMAFKRERKREKEREKKKTRIIGASSNRRPSQTSPFTLAHSTFLQPPLTEDQKRRSSELFQLQLHFSFLSGNASFLSSCDFILHIGYFASNALIFNEPFFSKKKKEKK